MATVAEVEAAVGQRPSMVMLKQIGALDEGCRSVLARCPLAGFGYRDAGGVSRTTFIGGTPGFVRVHSPTRISFALPEGEAHGPVSFVFLLPGIGETLRLNGSVVERKGVETFVDVQEAYVHCAQAVIRSRLWQQPVAEATPVIVGDGPLGGPGVVEFLAAAPFLVLSTWDKSGGGDSSPRGDQPTVARVLDGRTLLIADRRGNKRTDSLHNLLQDDRLSFAALVPGRTGVLHGRGRGSITDDPALLETVALRGTPPHAALLIEVEHAEVAANDAVARSRVWSAHVEPGAVPDLMVLAGEHLAANMAARRGVLARVLKVVGRIPGFERAFRAVMNRAYRSGLLKEGYQDVELGSRPARSAADKPLREVRVVEVRRETPSAVTLVLEDAERPRPFDFRPGQFFTLVADVDGRPLRRAYSASSAPGSPRLEITVKRVEGGRFSTHVHRNLRAGDRLSVRGPSGSFHVEPTSGEVVLVAAGSGVTPMMSVIRALLAEPTSGRIALLCSNRSEEEVIFADELLRLTKEHPERLTVTHVLTRERGRLDAAGVRGWLADLRPSDDARYYLCGPDGLMDTVGGVLVELGVPDDRVHRERYTSGADATATTAPQKMVVADGTREVGSAVVEPGQTLLDAGLAAGLPMPYSCTVGNCGDCVVKLRGGRVAMSGPNCLTPRQEADGYVLTCVGSPLTEVVLDIAAGATPPGTTA
ncbi:ferredoxin-NADP reductase/predicted pyridoxine 5'-phosphate oxidase superfamily flavin-nucleotide-binding protein [Saccharothrix coeruleofusca]|uniref:2Fe-2S iron-sulfur cluster-binding protein n=1 Tax=Saccharothrix coeruleofusca TaxID=33919 RepID=UPI001FD4B36B|nr:2Fe-2S iron-sulfur cluster-binding protein [Saccharothrix coeruleofusca]MBP2340060.1 ferredoxin-NADP reductase/predicted pyridoxine 5'-phosphate oxidase superfamily flavin-nucleotide-binding protein [Saccharothrix coeruleofusca]